MIIIILSLYAIFFILIGYTLLSVFHRVIALRDEVKELQQALLQVEKEHPILVKSDLLFSKQIQEITQQLVSMDNQLQELENLRQNDGAYQHALRILEMGGSRDEIVKGCHLSNAEAELLMNLQAYRTALGKQSTKEDQCV